MIHPTRVRVAVALALLSTLSIVVAVVLLAIDGVESGGQFWPALIFVGSVYAWIGARVVAREPRNVVGWLLLFGALIWAISFVMQQYAWRAAYGFDGNLPGANLAAWLGAWLWFPGTTLMLTFLPLHFPDGRLPSPRWRPVLGVLVGIAVVAVATQALTAWAYRDDIGFLLQADLTTTGPVADISNTLAFLSPLVAAVSVAMRLRASSGFRRLQLRWFAYAIALTAILVIIAGANSLDGVVGAIAWLLALSLMPIAIGIAILRYHLYDIDRVVSRTLAYALVTGSLVAVYLAVNLGLTTLFSSATTSNSVVVAASTLVVAALFTPLRRRVQHLVDRRFDRARYDAERTTSAFSERLRDEMDIATVTDDLDSTVRAAMAPASLGLWLRASDP